MPTVGEYVEEWVSGRQLERSTIAAYRRVIRGHITPELARSR